MKGRETANKINYVAAESTAIWRTLRNTWIKWEINRVKMDYIIIGTC